MSRVALVVSVLAALGASAEGTQVLTRAALGVEAQHIFTGSELLGNGLSSFGPVVSLGVTALRVPLSIGAELDWSHHDASEERATDCFNCRFFQSADYFRVGPVLRWGFFSREQVDLFAEISVQGSLSWVRETGFLAGGPDHTEFGAVLLLRAGALVRASQVLRLGFSVEVYGGLERVCGSGSIVAALIL